HASAQDLGAGQRARSSFARVGVPEPGTAGAVAAAAGLSGGVTEALSKSDSAHERFGASAAASVDVARFLNVGAWVLGRYDRHPHDARGKDDGFLVESELSARLSWRVGDVGLGLEAVGWLSGGPDIGTSLSGLSADGRALLSAHAGRLVVAGYGGYRRDRSAKGVGDPERLRAGDRSALGVSDFNAVLAGLGAGYPVGRTLLFGEVTGQILLGSPKLAASPIWVTLGARHQLGTSGLSAELSLDALASARPDVAPGAALFPIEPRVTLHVGLSYRFGQTPESKPAVVAPAPAPAPAPTPAATPSAPEPSSVELVLLDERGQPLARASVAVVAPEGETPLVETEPGHYRLQEARPGRAHLRIKAEGFRPVERDIEVTAGKPLRLDVRSELALPAGQVRGLVRSLRGKPLAASVRLEPGGAETKTDAEGFFQIDVPPGQYEVVIEAPGYEAQRRPAKVGEQGVVIVNADLQQHSGARQPTTDQP
ncbi:MAG TPA: carboxypeptidase-like regulatory domain-containing protein, partial [Polyangiaceae bacterium]|nr:carboxypeptidase-like regulatory domain-containing protein [Polyangiaceae bacterium]